VVTDGDPKLPPVVTVGPVAEETDLSVKVEPASKWVPPFYKATPTHTGCENKIVFTLSPP